jgi:hypothetical protein
MSSAWKVPGWQLCLFGSGQKLRGVIRNRKAGDTRGQPCQGLELVCESRHPQMHIQGFSPDLDQEVAGAQVCPGCRDMTSRGWIGMLCATCSQSSGQMRVATDMLLGPRKGLCGSCHLEAQLGSAALGPPVCGGLPRDQLQHTTPLSTQAHGEQGRASCAPGLRGSSPGPLSQADLAAQSSLGQQQ